MKDIVTDFEYYLDEDYDKEIKLIYLMKTFSDVKGLTISAL